MTKMPGPKVGRVAQNGLKMAIFGAKCYNQNVTCNKLKMAKL